MELRKEAVHSSQSSGPLAMTGSAAVENFQLSSSTEKKDRKGGRSSVPPILGILHPLASHKPSLRKIKVHFIVVLLLR